MPRNIEIKAIARDSAMQTQLAAQIATSGPLVIRQHDTFYRAASGRLKLRRFDDGTGELIQYERASEEGTKTSRYLIAPVTDVRAMHGCLANALGVIGDVKKRRTLYLAGRTRIHFDEVEGLGSFIELEVVLSESDDESGGHDEAKRIMAHLGIGAEDLRAGAYIDMLRGT